MKVYVIMGNDYPAAVLADEQAAEEYVIGKMASTDKNIRPRIHWRYYEFDLIGPGAAAVSCEVQS